MTAFRDYTFLGATQSLCPECLELIPAKIVERAGRVYFHKRCPDHGPREDFVCSDVRWWDRTDYSLPGKVPQLFGVEPRRGCPFDCGLCTDHEQHTCLGLLEINSACNLECPMCFASSGPGGSHLPLDDCLRAIDRLVEVEGRPEILQLSGGEPTIHPRFVDVWNYACDQPIDIVMVNTNGLRLANDRALVETLARRRERTEIYLQFDGFDDDGCRTLRGEPLVAAKLRAVERLGEAGLRTILVCTVQPGVNDDQLGRLVAFAASRPWISGVSFQPACYVGRCVEPATLERRVTFPDVIQGVCAQSSDASRQDPTLEQTCTWVESDFAPLPCAHPNAHTLAYAYRRGGELLPLARFVDLDNHLDLLSGRITFNRERARELVGEYLARLSCGETCSGGASTSVQAVSRQPSREATPRGIADKAATALSPDDMRLAEEFFRRALAEDLGPEDVFRITTTSFMDAYNFDVRQEMKACVHFVLPSGHIVPFSAYNLLYREGRAALPELGSTHRGVRGGRGERRGELVEGASHGH
jgi:uncharacterized radical SAM superfamily Fe-S cluster-containing enzyme